MKAPVALSREVLDAPRSTGVKVDYTELIDYLKMAEGNGNAGDVELESGETSKSAKKRLSNAMKQYNPAKRLLWLSSNKQYTIPDGHIWFIIVDAPKARTPKAKANANTETRTPVGATA